MDRSKLTRLVTLGSVTTFQMLSQQQGKNGISAASGRVIDARSGAGIKGATVGMFCEYLEGYKPGCAKDEKAISDASGRFVFPVAPPGHYLLIAFAKGFESIAGKPEVSIAIQDGQKTPESTLVLFPTGQISGSVLDRNNMGKPGVKVVAWKEDAVSHNRIPVSEAQTGSTGAFSLVQVPPGDLIISIGSDTKISRRLQLSPGDKLTNILLKEQ